MSFEVQFKDRIYVQVHGGPFDRGSADSYYRRGCVPHWYPEGTGFGVRIDAEDMTSEEIADYHAGYEYNESLGDYKDWG